MRTVEAWKKRSMRRPTQYRCGCRRSQGQLTSDFDVGCAFFILLTLQNSHHPYLSRDWLSYLSALALGVSPFKKCWIGLNSVKT